MTPREKAVVIVSRVAHTAGLTPERLFARTRDPRCDRARASAYRALVTELDWNQSQIARLFGRSRAAVSWSLSQPLPPADLEEQIEDLQLQLRRLAGAELAHQVAARLGLPAWQSIFMAILIEAYPKPRAVESMCELYDEASRMLGHGKQAGVNRNLVKAFSNRVNLETREQGFPAVVRYVPPGAYILTEDAALWCANNIGRPFIPAVAASRFAA